MTKQLPQSPRISVSMVEDHEETRLLWQRWLGRQPDLHVLDVFADGETALQALPQRPPHVLLVDWNLGEGRMDGIELIRQVKRSLPRVRCLICTAYDLDGLPASAVRVTGRCKRDRRRTNQTPPCEAVI